jgi:hypothetical protein
MSFAEIQMKMSSGLPLTDREVRFMYHLLLCIAEEKPLTGFDQPTYGFNQCLQGLQTFIMKERN